jgi:hypothetical protein
MPGQFKYLAAFCIVAIFVGTWSLPIEAQTLGVDVNVAVDQEARAELAALRKTLADSLLTLADAIPGGRYVRLVEDLNGPDPQKRIAAQIFLKNLAGLDPQIEYYASVWFEFDPTTPLHAIVRRARFPNQSEIVSRYIRGEITNASDVGSTPFGGPRPQQVREEIRQSLATAVADLDAGAKPDTVSFTIEGHSAAVPDPEPAKARARIVEALLMSFDTFYRGWPLPLQANVKTLPWPIFDEQQVLFVLIPESDWTAHNGNITVRALIHKRDDPKSPLPGADIVTFSRDEWNLIELRDAQGQRPPRDFRWAVHTMTDFLLISSETAAKLKAYKDALDAFDRARK